MTHLIVVRAFGPYRVGDVISDDAVIGQVTASEHAVCVVRIHPPEPGDDSHASKSAIADRDRPSKLEEN